MKLRLAGAAVLCTGIILASGSPATTVGATAEARAAAPSVTEQLAGSWTRSNCGRRGGPPEDKLQLLWHDEFGSPQLDRSKWNTVMDFPGRLGGHYHNTTYGSYALDENIVLRRGQLHLITNDEPVIGDDPPGEYDYSEGFISSHDLFSHVFGYWEICAKFPAGKGLWPAFWLIPQDRSWPPEFDVAEWFGSIEGLHQGLAYGPDWTDVTWESNWTYGPRPTDGWHTYGLRWKPDSATFYIDGEAVHDVSGDFIPDKAMYIVLNSGTWAPDDRGGPPDETTVFPNSFDVEYVRVYDEKLPEPADCKCHVK